jgi:hypothetical protein
MTAWGGFWIGCGLGVLGVSLAWGLGMVADQMRGLKEEVRAFIISRGR